MVEQLLASLPSGSSCELLPLVDEVKPLEQARRVDIAFESAQAHLFIGQPGIARQHPDYLPLIVGNYVLGGGGFVSRLTEQVREKRGLSYSVYSYFSPGQHAGAFTVGLQTRPDQAQLPVEVQAFTKKQGTTLLRFCAGQDGAQNGEQVQICPDLPWRLGEHADTL